MAAAAAAGGCPWPQIMGSTASSSYPRTLTGSLGLPRLLVGSRPLHNGLFRPKEALVQGLFM